VFQLARSRTVSSKIRWRPSCYGVTASNEQGCQGQFARLDAIRKCPLARCPIFPKWVRLTARARGVRIVDNRTPRGLNLRPDVREPALGSHAACLRAFAPRRRRSANLVSP
jgi:hypothetical protein